MKPRHPPPSPIEGLRAVHLTARDAPMLQQFFDANPAYFLAVQGEPAGPEQALSELTETPPSGVPWSTVWQVAYVEASGRVAAFAGIVTDLFAPDVCHIGLFIVDTSRHGTGDAQHLYAGIEQWARDHGTAWMRLGVVVGNTRAERFWARCGFLPVRTREGYVMGRRTNVVAVLVKPLGGRSLDGYLGVVARDRPD
ncbi:MAG: GNAT family N-acetyltransferase [Vitreoscilla sp.]